MMARRVALKFLLAILTFQIKSVYSHSFVKFYEKCSEHQTFACEHVREKNAEQLRLLKKEVRSANLITDKELLVILTTLPANNFYSNNEKQLLDLRDLLRAYTNRDWKARDLFRMNIPSNLNILAMALSKTAFVAPELVSMILTKIEAIINESKQNARDVFRNSQDQHNGLLLSKIYEYFDVQLLRLKLKEPMPYAVAPASAPSYYDVVPEKSLDYNFWSK